MSGTGVEVGLAIDEFLAAHGEELTRLAGDLVRINSQIPPHGDEPAIVAFLRERLRELGLGGGEVLAAEQERPNLVTTVPGRGGGRTLMLNGHLGTKPVGDALPLWHSDPLSPQIRGGRLYGLGASDMKGAVAAMVFAALALRESGVPRPGGDLVLAFTADEEAGSTLGSKFVAPRLAD